MRLLDGWILVLWTALLVGAASLLSWLDGGWGALIRTTARTSLVLFSLAFAARAANQLFGAKWLLRNRRYLGVSFAVSHGFHLVGIAAVAVEMGVGRFFASLDAGTYLGFVAYLFILAMVATSFDATTRWLGRRRWKILHTTGMYVLMVPFVFTFAGAAAKTGRPLYLALAAVALVAPALRLIAFIASRRTARRSPSSAS